MLIHGQPGAGKSHLARQYVNKNRKKFEGGIFWINARLKQEIYQAYWNIAQKVVLPDSPHLRITADGSQRPFEDIVKVWFEARHDWLIVFDGILIDKEEDAIELQNFIPDSPDSSIIYVSRASNLGNKQRLLRPFPIKVHSLSEDDARRLLFKELLIKKPTEAEKKSATELVRKMGGLPLAIHAISHRLGNTHEPLIKYDMKSYSADPKLGGTYNAIMGDLVRLNHQGAWNSISLMCFYGPHLPVEMIRLGIKALRPYGVEVNSSWNGERPDLDITFAILMRNALIERNEPYERSPISASRDSLIDPEPIDMITMHSVVQKFCCDFLNSANILPRWLGYAVDVFCESFRRADERIKAKPLHSRVSDYREYLVHGNRLFDHSKEYQTKKQNLEAVRQRLTPILAQINAEIQAREPSSSQESVGGHMFQISVFDRSSSTSDSLASENQARTPNQEPPPFMPHESWYGGDLTKVQVETPTSIHSISPRIVDHSPRCQLPHLLDEELFDTDEDVHPLPHAMHRIASDSTAMPYVAPVGSQDEGWQTVPPSRRVNRPRDFQTVPIPSNNGRPRPHRDLGSFRPTPARAEMPGITNVDAVGLFSRPTRGNPRGKLSEGSDAVSSLTAVHHSASPPSSRDGSRSQQRSLSRPRTSASTQPTYAMIAAGQQPQRPVAMQHGGLGYDGTGVPGPYPFAPTPSVLQRGRSPESLRRRSGNIQPSPLAAEFKPRRQPTQATSHETSPYAAPPVHQGSAHHTPDHSPHLHYISSQPDANCSPPQSPYLSSQDHHRIYYNGPVLSGPNPANLAFEENISITPKRRLPSDFQTPYPPSSLQTPYPNPHPNLHAHPNAYPLSFDPAPIPTGYGSHPMTRDHSPRSHASAAATDPLLYQHGHPSSSPRFSPHMDLCPRSRDRDRTADGRPLSKSPKFYHAVPVPAEHDHDHDALSGTGGWAFSSPAASPTSAPGLRREGSGGSGGGGGAHMSRAGSGPGVAFESPGGQMEIAEFGGRGEVVQFGELAPVVIEEGRGRVREWERRLREGGSAGGVVPYPVRDVMPRDGREGGGDVGMGGGGGGGGAGAVGLGLEMEVDMEVEVEVEF